MLTSMSWKNRTGSGKLSTRETRIPINLEAKGFDFRGKFR